MRRLENETGAKELQLRRAHNETPVNAVVEPVGFVVKQTVVAEEGAA
jgi:hypothetical protein